MKQPIRVLMVTIALTMGVTAFAGSTNTYKWVDEDGNVHYSQRPPSGSNYEKMKVKTPPPGSSPSEASQGEASEGDGATSNGGKAVENQLAKSREIRRKNCEAAKKNLQAYTVFRKVRMPDGTVKRLDDDERAKLIEESKASIKEFCDE